MGGGGSKSEDREDINDQKDDSKEEAKKSSSEEDEEDDETDDPVARIVHQLKKKNPDVAAIKELCNKAGEAKINLNKADLPPVIDPKADPKDPHVMKMLERIAKKTYLGDYPMHFLVGRPETENTPELLELVKFFFLKEHNMNARNKLGSTPLHRACAAGNVSMAKELIQWGAQVDDVNDMQLSCLSMACYAGHVEVVKLLLSNGCAKHIMYKSRYGVAPRDYVLKDEIFQLLKAAHQSASKSGAGAGADGKKAPSSAASAAAAALVRQVSSNKDMAEGDESKQTDE